MTEPRIPDRGQVLRAADPVVRILGPGVGRNGPFGVLGLPVADLDDAAIMRAVHKAKATIDAHAEARTPAADEARLAVHAAAANLLDPGVRGALLDRLSGRGRSRKNIEKPRARTAPADPASSALLLEADFLRAIGAGGGWGPVARDRFFKLAHARGIDTRTAVASIRGLVGVTGGDIGGAAPVQGMPETRLPETRLPARAEPPRVQRIEPGSPPVEMEDSGDGSALRAVITVCVIVVLMVLIGGITLLLINGDPPAAAPSRTPAAPSRAPTAETTNAGETELPIATGRILDNGPAVIFELETVTDGLSVDPAASLEGFEVAVSSLAERWGGFAVSDRVAAQDLIVGFMYRVSGRRVLMDRAHDAIAAGLGDSQREGPPTAADVWKSAWSLGTLVRLRRETNLPSGLLRKIDSSVALAAGRLAPNASTFRAGAVAALRRLGDPLSETGLAGAGVETWQAWVEAVREASSGDGDLAGSMLISAIDGRLRHGLRTAAGDAEVIMTLVGSLDWSEGSAARAWLVRAFDDRSLGVTELHVVTLGLASESAAGGVNHSMVLPRGAGDYDRRVLRDRFMELWGIAENADQGVTLYGWVSEAGDALAEPVPAGGRSDVEGMAEIVRLARLNAAAAMLWRAETTGAADLLADLDGPIDAVIGGSSVPDLDGLFSTGGGTWAEEYLSAGSHIARRVKLLNAIASRSGKLGAMEAEVVVRAALRGTPRQVRDAAAAIVEAQAAKPTIVNAVLEALPLMPKTKRNALIVEIVAGTSLPDIDAGNWAFEARRGVVERLLELIAGRGVYARVDGLAGLLDEAYSDRLGRPGGGSAGSQMPVLRGEEGARALAARWIASAERRPPATVDGITIAEIRGRRAARLSAADGLVQAFHAEQLALAEAMAQVIAGEGLGRAERVSGLLDEMRLGRTRAQSVLTQIEYTERMMLGLWVLRFGEETR